VPTAAAAPVMSYLRDEPCTHCGADVMVTSIERRSHGYARLRSVGRAQRSMSHVDARETIGDSQVDARCNRPAKTNL
jgi:hypothetical protein